MALTEDNYEGTSYLNIYQGKLALVATENTPNAVSRQNKNDKTVWEVYYKSVSGLIKNVSIEDTDFGQMCYVIIQDIDEKYKLAFPVKSDYFSSLAKKAQNINVLEKVSISPYSFEDKQDKTRKISGLNIFQNGEKIENFITKDNPMGGPTLRPNASVDEKDQFKLDIVRFYKKQIQILIDNLKEEQDSPSVGATEQDGFYRFNDPEPSMEDFGDLPF